MQYRPEEISKRLKELRVKKGLTQEQLANTLGVSHDTISKYENYKKNQLPTLEILIYYSMEFNTSLDFLAFGQECGSSRKLKHMLRGLNEEETNKIFEILDEFFDFIRSLK